MLKLINRRYDFEYEDDDEEQGGDVDIENKYYNAKQLKGDDPEAAIDEFLGVPALEEEKGDWYAASVRNRTHWLTYTVGDLKVLSKLSSWSSSFNATRRFGIVCMVELRREAHINPGCRTLPGAPHLR